MTEALCVICNLEPVDVAQGYDTCEACESILTGIAPGAIARRRAAAPTYPTHHELPAKTGPGE